LLALRWLGLDPFAELDPAVPDERFRIISEKFSTAPTLAGHREDTDMNAAEGF
jgi:hypothetical protein